MTKLRVSATLIWAAFFALGLCSCNANSQDSITKTVGKQFEFLRKERLGKTFDKYWLCEIQLIADRPQADQVLASRGFKIIESADTRASYQALLRRDSTFFKPGFERDYDVAMEHARDKPLEFVVAFVHHDRKRVLLMYRLED